MFTIKHTPALVGLTILLLCSSGITVAKDKVTPEQLATETAERMAADAALQADINAERDNRIADVNAEETARVATDSLLQSNIDAEEAARMTADGTLQTAVDNEVAARILNDNSLQGGINALSTELDNLETIVLSTMLYARSNTVTLLNTGGANMVMLCDSGDKVVGGSCKFSIDPVANNTVILNDGPVPESEGFESWNCDVSNNGATASIDVTTSSICMSVPSE